MITITHVVCPIDFSECSRHALDYAAAFATWYESRLSIVHVFPPPASMDLPVLIDEKKERDRVLCNVKRFVGPLHAAPPFELRVLAGASAAKTIIRDADETAADLLVLGSHGRAGLERIFLGSVAEQVVRHARCPVLVVPRRVVEAQRPAEMHRVLCAVDFSEASLQALEYAMTIAEETDADLTLLHVYSFPPDLLPDSADERVSLHRLNEQVDIAKQQLDGLIPADLVKYCAVETVVRAGAVHREILDTAASLQSDLIVMGVHGRSALDLLMFGSNTARVLCGATCPVLVVRRH